MYNIIIIIQQWTVTLNTGAKMLALGVGVSLIDYDVMILYIANIDLQPWII